MTTDYENLDYDGTLLDALRGKMVVGVIDGILIFEDGIGVSVETDQELVSANEIEEKKAEAFRDLSKCILRSGGSRATRRIRQRLINAGVLPPAEEV